MSEVSTTPTPGPTFGPGCAGRGADCGSGEGDYRSGALERVLRSLVSRRLPRFAPPPLRPRFANHSGGNDDPCRDQFENKG
jgi:hypothetical protein